MAASNNLNPNTRHWFLDEAGDTAFYGPGKKLIIGVYPGVSLCFILGMVKFGDPLNITRLEVMRLQGEIGRDPYFADVPSIVKKRDRGGFYFHATDDPPEVRKVLYDYIKELDLSFEAVVARKIPGLFAAKHNNREAEFYADLLSHLLKNKLQNSESLVLNVAQRGNVTRNETLNKALSKATARRLSAKPEQAVRTRVVFNVQNPYTEPLLNVADYLCWAIQRVFEKGEMRYYNYIEEKVSLVVDLYDSERQAGNQNYYTHKNKLSPKNKISPPSY